VVQVLVRFSSFLAILSTRRRLLAFMNLAFFWCLFLVLIAFDFLFPHPLYLGQHPSYLETFSEGNLAIKFLDIFFSNLVLSSFVFVTLPGVVFFPLSAGFLLFRAFVWGSLIRLLPTWAFLVVMPTLVLEGEAYVLAAIAGTVVGVSWIRSKWLYGEESLTRTEAFKKALKECILMYILVVIFLFIAAVVEVATLMAII